MCGNSLYDRPEPVRTALFAADCSRCAGLCCTALYFGRGREFPFEKPAGTTCKNLGTDCRCTVHPQLERLGCHGCRVYECLGAGVRACALGRGRSREALGALYLELAPLRETLWYLHCAASLAPAAALRGELEQMLADGFAMEEKIAGTGVPAAERTQFEARARVLLRSAIALCCRAAAPKGGLRRVREGVGRRFAGDWSGADFGMALLLAADFRGARLAGANFLAADLRDADLRGADLSESLFLTPMQLASARGDAATALPPLLTRPETWAD